MGANERIREALVPEFLEHQEEKAKDYNGSLVPGVENADVLGARGQYAELWRKMAKLKKSLWDGQALVGEQPREVLLDFIGHCFLAIDMLDRQQMAEDPPMAAPAILCPRCGHQAFMHDDGKPRGGCIGKGPGHACGCDYSCQYINIQVQVELDRDASDRDRLRRLVGHGYDRCAVCAQTILVIEAQKGSAFDWEQDIP